MKTKSTHFSATLKVLMERNKVSGKQISKNSALLGKRLGSSFISRVLHGQQIWVSARDLEMFCKCVTPNRDEQAELVKAHLLDERPPFAAHLIIVSTTKGASAPNPLVQLNPAVRGSIEFLSTRTECHQVLVSLARSMGYLNS